MSQKSIMSFFKSSTDSGPKRLNDSEPMNSSKKMKGGSFETSAISGSNHVNELCEENRFKAKLKLQTKKTPALSPNIGLSWFKALEKEFQKAYFYQLSEFIQKERNNSTVYPKIDDVFTWTHLCNIRDVKIVILGQDPYHGPGQAHGLAFSVPVGMNIPPSLVNIYKELCADIASFERPSHGFLKGWAVQGVLLLNACLTVKAHCPNSHSNYGWEQLTDATIQWINDNLQNVVFLLWGAYAQKKRVKIDKNKHLVLSAPHPSPLSASRGFFGCRHFSGANEYLVEHGKNAVNWSHLPDQ